MTDQDLSQIRALLQSALNASVASIGTEIEYALRRARFTEWITKADADHLRVLAELADLKLRVAKLENPES